MKEQLLELCYSGDRVNIELALELNKGSGADLLNIEGLEGLYDLLVKTNSRKFQKEKPLAEKIEQLFHLKDLKIKGMKLRAIPAVIFNLRQLEKLDLSVNEIAEIPEEIFGIQYKNV